MAAIFKTVAWEVDQLVNGVRTGTIQLPDLQRPFVWPSSKVRDLFDSMYRGYPVGELMFWDVAAEDEARSISKHASLGAQHQIIDGQQRLTSLFAAIQGVPVRDESYRERRIRIAFNPFTEKFEVWTPILAKQPGWVEDVSAVFAAPVKAKRAFIKRFRESGEELDEDEEIVVEETLDKLSSLAKYLFDVVHIQRDVDKRLVADVFVRINSEGVRLKAYDYILTWLSVFWPEGREEIENFARNGRMSPQHASSVLGEPIRWTAYNPYIAVDTGHVVRAMVAVGQRRGRLQDSYAALQAKERGSGLVDSGRQERELDLLKQALPMVIDPVNWTEFIRSIQIAGFRSGQNITSNMNIIYSYVIFLLGRTQYKVELVRLRVLVARWLFMSQLTSRYTGSSESQIQKDMDRLSGLADGDAKGFERVLEEIISAQLTADFWRYNMPQNLITSGPGLSPHYQCYLAALNILDADMFMLDSKVRAWMDPSQPVIKGTEGHHLFPRKYQENVLGTTDMKRINQVSNFAPTDWNTNILISDDPPAAYWPKLVAQRSKGQEWLDRQMYWHALPDGWEHLEYEEFLSERRALMARVTKDAFETLHVGTVPNPGEPDVSFERPVRRGLQDFLESGVLVSGDLLDPVDPEWVVDAVVNDDGSVVIDGVDTFDSLDEAAKHLGVTNMSGEEFWALEWDDTLLPLAELSQRPAANT